MDLASLLETKRIVAELESSNKANAIEELVNHLCLNNYLSSVDKPEIIESLFEREDRTTTGIGSGVAIPHVQSNKIEVEEPRSIVGERILKFLEVNVKVN